MACDHIKVLNLVKDHEWDKAHQLVQSYSDKLSCLIHGYLHREEGDVSNAHYWYNRAKSEMPDNSLDDELTRLFLLVKEES